MRWVIPLICLAAPAVAQESTAPIRLALTDRTAQQVATVIMGRVLVAAGYGVDYVPTDTVAQFDLLATGDIELAMHVSEATSVVAMQAGADAGTIDTISPTGLNGQEDWWIPAHMLAACPYLTDVAALQDPACAAAFATADTAPLARLVTGPAHWGGNDAARAAALGLLVQVEQVATEGELWAALETAIADQSPIILTVPLSHWTAQTLDGAYLDMPPWEPDCDLDPAWGENPAATGDCGRPFGTTWNIAWSGFDDNWPGAAATVQSFFLTSADMAIMTAQVDRDGLSVDQVVDGWMAANEETWRLWAGL